MTRTDRYVLREALVPLILSLLIATIMIILLQLQQELGGAGRSGMSPDLLGMRILRALPQVIALAMPIACALGCSLAANRICRDNETIALRAAALAPAKNRPGKVQNTAVQENSANATRHSAASCATGSDSQALRNRPSAPTKAARSVCACRM